MMTMRAAVYREFGGPLLVEELAVPRAPPLGVVKHCLCLPAAFIRL